MYAKFSKYKFLLKDMNFLWHIFSKTIVIVDPTKVWTIVSGRVQDNIRNKKFYIIGGLLWEVNQWLFFISGTNEKVDKQRCQVLWDLKCKISFKLLKKSLTLASVLTLHQWTEWFLMSIDASRMGLGIKSWTCLFWILMMRP